MGAERIRMPSYTPRPLNQEAANSDPHREYIGDGVYVTFDSFHLVLTTENGIQITNEIFIEPQVWLNLTEYVKKQIDRRKTEIDGTGLAG